MNQILGIGATLVALLGAMLFVGVTGATDVTVYNTSNLTVFETLKQHPLGDWCISENLSHLRLTEPGPDGKFHMRPINTFDASPAPGDINMDWQPSI